MSQIWDLGTYGEFIPPLSMRSLIRKLNRVFDTEDFNPLRFLVPYESETCRVQRPMGIEALHQKRPKKRGRGAKLPIWPNSIRHSSLLFKANLSNLSTTSIEEEKGGRGRPRFCGASLPSVRTECEFDARRRRHRRVNTFSEEEESERDRERGCEKPPRDGRSSPFQECARV